MTFLFLPLLGISQAMQAITGNNYGANLWHRSNKSLLLAIMIALIYCLVAQIILMIFAQPIGFFFVDDQYVVNEVARIMPIMTIMFFIAGPLIMISHYFQAIGDAGRAAILGLSKTYLFSIPLTFLLPFTFGEKGIWMAGPIAEILLLGLTLIVLTKTARQHDLKWGLFKSER